MMFFKQHWQVKPAEKISSRGSVQPLLVMGKTLGQGNFMKDSFNLEECYSLVFGKQLDIQEGGNFIINPDKPVDWRELLTSLPKAPKNIVFIAEPELFNPQLLLERFCCLFQALINNNVDSVRVIFCYSRNNSVNATYAALDAFFKCIEIEKPGYIFQCLEVYEEISNEKLSEIIINELQQEPVGHSIYHSSNGERFIRKLVSTDSQAIQDDGQKACGEICKEGGTYLITGGLGALGLIFAKHLIEDYRANVVLCGRSSLSAEKAEKLKALNGSARYIQADISDIRQCAQLFDTIQSEYSTLHGVIHCAGNLCDKFILNITAQDIHNVLAAKVDATENLVRNLREKSLDFFAFFSSWAGVTGNEGQAIYAYANAYLNYRAQELAEQMPELGKITSIAWPLWKGDGMGDNQELQEKLFLSTGMEPLQHDWGIEAFNTALNHGAAMLAFFSGKPKNLDLERIAFLPLLTSHTENTIERRLSPAIIQACEKFLREILAEESGIAPTEIDKHRSFEELGLDSIMISRLNRKLAVSFVDLSKTLFFECRTLAELTGWLVENRPQNIFRLFAQGDEVKASKKVPLSTTSDSTNYLQNSRKEVLDKFHQYINQRNTGATISRFIAGAVPGNRSEAIAIVGCAGRYPQADTLDDFWKNLLNGRDSITEIPEWRWDHKQYFDAQGAEGKTYAKWGGFINDIEMFDPLFFNISPKDAEYLDPQDRLFLQTAWHTIEDAGYTRDTLKDKKVGVYLGVMWSQYQLYGPMLAERGDYRVPASSFASIANRVSYFMDFTGPSIAIDTMCSSSLTALHLGCESIRRGECDYALVGGVNLSIHPQKYLYLGQGKFPSTDGRCRSFGEGGDGYVPGEGVGAVLLKPLSVAIAEKDNVYGVILGSALNHGGKTNGYTVPNPKAQFNVIASALDCAKISADTINYIECHGTGTALGDPIEIAGLEQAFSKNKPAKAETKIAIGSVKSNIGHLEAAAGMASLTKVLLQFKARMLVPSLHSDPPNSNINFSKSPFRVQTSIENWEQNGSNPRRACISSFGAGGSNAHIVLEEYPDQESLSERSGKGPFLFLLSAKTAEALSRYVDDYIQALTDGLLKHANAEDICFTSQTSREFFDHRIAMVITDSTDLRQKLRDYHSGQQHAPHVYCGNSKQSQLKEFLFDQRDLEETIATSLLQDALEKGSNWEKLAKLWVNGSSINWMSAYAGRTHSARKLRLPLYPFAKEPCWLDLEKLQVGAFNAGPANNAINSLLGSNISTFYQQKYEFVLDGQRYFLRDHQYENKVMLPGAAIIEMSIQAAQAATGSTVNKLSNIRWLSPVILEEGEKRLNLELFADEDQDSIGYKLYEAGNPSHVYSEGVLTGLAEASFSGIDLDIILSRCNKSVSPALCYQLFKEYGLEYGDHFQTIQELRLGDDELIARIAFAKTPQDKGLQRLHVCLLDGTFQTVIGLIEQDRLIAHTSDNNILQPVLRRRLLPESIQTFTFIDSLPSEVWVHVRRSKEKLLLNSIHDFLFDMDIVNLDGKKIAEVKRFCLAEAKLPITSGNEDILYVTPQWRAAELTHTEMDLFANSLLVVGTDGHLAGKLKAVGTGTVVMNAIPATAAMATEHDIIIDFDSEGAVAQVLRDIGVPDVVVVQSTAMTDSGVVTVADDNYNSIATLSLQRHYIFLRQLLDKKSKASLRLLLIFPRDAIHSPLAAALGALFATAKRENPEFSYKIVEVDTEAFFSDLERGIWMSHIVDELGSWNNAGDRIRIDINGKRDILQLDEFRLEDNSKENIKISASHYLITGGAGALGFIFAKYIAQRGAGKITLVGRREKNSIIRQQLTELSALGVHADYRCVDISVASDVIDMVASFKKEGGIKGVVHAAGFIKDNLICNKSPEDFVQIIAPKVAGTINLINALADSELDFFVGFSSVAALNGNLGQAGYATANAFMDAYLGQQESIGKFVSINWPLWTEGMDVNEKALTYLKNSVGMHPLPPVIGTLIFDRILQENCRQIGLLYGDKAALRRSFLSMHKANEVVPDPLEATLVGDDANQSIKNYLYEKISSLLGLDKARIRPDISLEEYGVDSAATINLMALLEKDFGKLSKTLLFEYPTISQLIDYFTSEHSTSIKGILMKEELPSLLQTDAGSKHEVQVSQAKKLIARPLKINGRDRLSNREIAIVGLSGRYPMAENLDEFWDNLREGRDCISEIPHYRWNHTNYYDPDPKREGKIYAKWGGFLRDIDKFDALFFKISPREAELMDPQERLFLQTVWHTLEDAGYPASMLAKRKVGVFVGAMWNHYQLLGLNSSVGSVGYLAPNSSMSSIANRISYVFDFRGPSLSLDSMCSSSLSSLHLACESILRGESELAIAGGVNLNTHENKYFQLSQNRFLASDGRCRSFGAGGDGYVPGEGVGAVLLKPLDEAEQDGDKIYGVILGSAINHGGKTKGYTVPSPASQAEVVRAALAAANLKPRDISYIEAHGTGTSLGDPIEIEGLGKALHFNSIEGTRKIAIGSVKSNIGHLEGAAGVAALTKVLLQFQYNQRVPSIHSEPANPNIDFSNTAFEVQTRLVDWSSEDYKEGNIVDGRFARISGISSFGAGGSNAHVIVADYIKGRQNSCASNDKTSTTSVDKNIFVLSAKDHEDLSKYIQAFINKLSKPVKQDSLDNICFSLQTGREHFNCRLAVICSDIDDLLRSLSACSGSLPDEETIFFGQADIQPEDAPLAIDKHELTSIARAWVNGRSIFWPSLYTEKKPLRISLPGYPFKQDRYWYGLGATTGLEPYPFGWSELSLKYESDVSATVEANIPATSYWIEDHVIHGQAMLPGAAYLELARRSLLRANRLHQSMPSAPNTIRNIVWSAAFNGSEEALAIDITAIKFQGQPGVGFTIASSAAEFCRGQLGYTRDIPTVVIHNASDEHDLILQGDKIYDLFAEHGFCYGRSLRVLQKTYHKKHQVIAELILNPSYFENEESSWPPAALDGAFQVCLALHLSDEHPTSHKDIRYIPLSIGEVIFARPVSHRLMITATRKTPYRPDQDPMDSSSFITKFDVKCVDETGATVITITDFTVIGRSVSAVRKKMQDAPKPLFFKAVWEHCN